MTKKSSKASKGKGRKKRAKRSRKSTAPPRPYRMPKTAGELNRVCQQPRADRPVCGNPLQFYDPDYLPLKETDPWVACICGDHPRGPRAQKLLIKEDQQELRIAV